MTRMTLNHHHHQCGQVRPAWMLISIELVAPSRIFGGQKK
jgi:hypothetical protein